MSFCTTVFQAVRREGGLKFRPFRPASGGQKRPAEKTGLPKVGSSPIFCLICQIRIFIIGYIDDISAYLFGRTVIFPLDFSRESMYPDTVSERGNRGSGSRPSGPAAAESAPERRLQAAANYGRKKGYTMLREFFRELVNAHFDELSRMQRELRNK